MFSLIKTHVKDARKLTDVGAELSIQLPQRSQYATCEKSEWVMRHIAAAISNPNAPVTTPLGSYFVTCKYFSSINFIIGDDII